MKTMLISLGSVIGFVTIALCLLALISRPTLEGNAKRFGHGVAVYIQQGHSFSPDYIYAVCSMEAQKEGYKGEELERFVNIVERQASQELK